MRKPKQQTRIYKGYVVIYSPENPEQYRWEACAIKEFLYWRFLRIRFYSKTLKELKQLINREKETP